MAGPMSNEVFDIRKIRRLMVLMQENDLSEIDLQHGEMRIQLRRNTMAVAPAVAPPTAPAPAPPVSAAEPTPGKTEEAPDESHLVIIKSPMVGTFYAAPDPESPPFVKVGDQVNPDMTVCLLEAMKVFNEIQAETSGKVVSILAKNGDPIEFGQPLMKIDPAG